MALDPKLQKFTTASPVLSNFNYTDIADGTGVSVFFLHKTTTSITTSYKLGTQVLYGATRSTSISETLDDDYDLTAFNIPRTVEGTGLIEIPWGLSIGGASGTVTLTITATLRKWDGTTETDIASVISPTASQVNTGADTGAVGFFTLPIVIPATVFSSGDVLR